MHKTAPALWFRAWSTKGRAPGARGILSRLAAEQGMVPMIVAICTLDLRLPENGSLKGKRQVLQSIMANIRNNFNAAVAEVEHQDSWQRATLGLATVSTASDYAHGLLNSIVQMVERGHWDIEVIDYSIEIL